MLSVRYSVNEKTKNSDAIKEFTNKGRDMYPSERGNAVITPSMSINVLVLVSFRIARVQSLSWCIVELFSVSS